MSNKIILKRSSVVGKVPPEGSLDYGELALNYADGKLYYRDSDDIIRNLISSGGAQTIFRETYVAVDGDDTFIVTYTPPNIDVFINGIKLKPSEYSATSGSNVILNEECVEGDVVDLVGYTTSAFLDGNGTPADVYWNDILNKPDFTTVATSGSYTDLINTPTIPSTLSELTNDSGFITSSALTGYATETYVDDAIAAIPPTDLTGYATETYVNAQGFITSSALTGYATETYVNTQGFITSSALTGYATEAYVDDAIAAIPPTDFTGYATETYVDDAIAAIPPTDLTGYATETYVNAQGFITTSALTGYATETYVNAQGFITSSALDGYATETYVTSALANLVDAAPSTLDTLNELAAALGDDANFATTVTTAIGEKQDTLVSGVNIKTINGTSILGSGDIDIPHEMTVNATSASQTTIDTLDSAQIRSAEYTITVSSASGFCAFKLMILFTGSSVLWNVYSMLGDNIGDASAALVGTDIEIYFTPTDSAAEIKFKGVPISNSGVY